MGSPGVRTSLEQESMIKVLAQEAPLTIATYAARVEETDRFTDASDRTTKLSFGFFGEIGGLLAALKKVNRDRLLQTETEVAGEEIGDSVWYLIAMANAHRLGPQAVGIASLTWLRKRFAEAEREVDGDVDFRQIDGLIAIHGRTLVRDRVELLGELARVGAEVVGRAATAQLELETPSQTDLLGRLLALLGLVAASFMLKLEDIARDNVSKTHGRWPGTNPIYHSVLDATFPAHERLPRAFRIEFIERTTPRGTFVVQRLNDVYVGDPLTDNRNEPDDYRFHDVFHLAYIAHLGWSPVVRALLKLKRKSSSKVDENEDGARAMIIEEGIATWIFNHASHRDLYAGVAHGRLDYGLLKQVQGMVRGYEVAACPLWQWERAILDGFRVFRELKKPEHRGGTVVVDMNKHTLEFVPLSKAET